MSVQVEASVTIAAPLEAVLAVVRDVASQPQWWPGMLDSEVLEVDDAGLVARARLVNDVKIARDEFELRYRHSDTTVSWQLHGTSLAQRAHDGSWTLTPSGTGTHAHLALGITTSLPLPGFVQRRVLGDTANKAVAALKDRCES